LVEIPVIVFIFKRVVNRVFRVHRYSKIFRQITMHFIIGCNLSRTRVERAINLSLEKYCSVAKTLEPTASIDWKLTLNGEE
jgi:putative redox protein